MRLPCGISNRKFHGEVELPGDRVHGEVGVNEGGVCRNGGNEGRYGMSACTMATLATADVACFSVLFIHLFVSLFALIACLFVV